MGVQDQALEEIKTAFGRFHRTHTWEELCREWLLRATGHHVLPFMPEQVGSIWNRKRKSMWPDQFDGKDPDPGRMQMDRHPIDLAC